LEWARQRLQLRGWQPLGNLLVGVVLAVGSALGIYDYFVRHGDDPELAYFFEADQVLEAVEINRFLGSGWQGEGIFEPRQDALPGRHVYLAPRMWESRLTVNFLVASPDEVSILGRDPPTEAEQVLALVWPHGSMVDVMQVLPRPARIDVWPGPLERGDLDPEPRLLYVAFRAARLRETASAIAQFEEGIELLGWETESGEDGRTRVTLRWRAKQTLDQDYTTFVHLIREGQIVAQEDGVPGSGFFPTSWWEPGDEIVDVRLLDAPYDPEREQMIVGWYQLDSMQHLRVLDENAQAGTHELVLR
jgi:hypothetical protein